MKKFFIVCLSMLIFSNYSAIAQTEIEKPEDKIKNSLEITKEPLNLKSNILKEYGYQYTFKNNSSEAIIIKDIENTVNPHQIIINKQKNRPYIFIGKTFELAFTPVEMAVGLVGLTLTAPGAIVYSSYYLISKDEIYLNSIPNTTGKSMKLIKKSAKKMVTIPFNTITVPIKDIKAIKEASKNKPPMLPITIEPQTEKKIGIFQNKWGTPKIIILSKDQEYKINK